MLSRSPIARESYGFKSVLMIQVVLTTYNSEQDKEFDMQ